MAAALAPVSAARAQEPTTPEEAAPAAPDPRREWIGGAPWRSWPRASGDWASMRTSLEECGVEASGGITTDWAAAWRGGARNRDSVTSLFDFNLALDLDTLLSLPRTIAFVDAYEIQGRAPSNDIGDLQGVSNIQAPNTSQISEAWIETWIGDSLRLKVGKVDCNSEFAFTELAGELVNPSAGISPSIQSAPTYPNPAASVNLFWTPTESSYLGLGVYDGAGAVGVNTGSQGISGFFRDDESDAYFTIAEFGFGWTGGNSWGSGRMALGAWHHGEDFARFDGGVESGTFGCYSIFEQFVWRQNPDEPDDPRGVGVFASLGLADEDVAQVCLHAQGGLRWNGPLASRPDDVVSFLVSHAALSDAPGAGFAQDETTFELCWRLQITPSLAIKPDLQYVLHPSGDPSLDDALVGLLRVELTF